MNVTTKTEEIEQIKKDRLNEPKAYRDMNVEEVQIDYLVELIRGLSISRFTTEIPRIPIILGSFNLVKEQTELEECHLRMTEVHL